MKRSLLFVWSALALVLLWVLLGFVAPWAFQVTMGRPGLVRTPSTLMQWYMALGVGAVFVYVTTSDERLRQFLLFLAPGRGTGLERAVRGVVLAGFPLVVGWLCYSAVRPASASPVELRVQHPNMPPGAARTYGTLVNPLRNPSPERLADFAKEKGLAGLPEGQLRLEFESAVTEEGRVDYQAYCRPCHGSKAAGEGEWARGFRLRPIAFTDPGMIATLVENVLFWRIKEGGPGLPPEATPWDSGMPPWEDRFPDERIWKIIMGEFDTAGVKPREPERLGP